jgi:polyhydroxybutyrate depolymerase
MKSLLTTLLFLFTGTIFGQNIVDSFLVDGVYRNYILHIPTGYSSATQHPLVLNLHGYTSNASQEQLYTQMDVTADANNFLVVYPNGISNYWNSFGAGANDVKFLDSLIERIKQSYNIDTKCIYSCGMSNGGFMSYTLACQLSHKIAALLL